MKYCHKNREISDFYPMELFRRDPKKINVINSYFYHRLAITVETLILGTHVRHAHLKREIDTAPDDCVHPPNVSIRGENETRQ